METVTSGLCYIKELILLENNIDWFRNFLDVQWTHSLVELYNILTYYKHDEETLDFFMPASYWRYKKDPDFNNFNDRNVSYDDTL